MKTVTRSAGLVLTLLLVGAISSSAQLRPSAFRSQPKASAFNSSDSGYLSNTAIDIIKHAGGIWLATGQGLNATSDDGLTWSIYNATSGGSQRMVSDNISALFSVGDRLWIASNHSQLISGGLYTISDGVSYSDDDGLNWTQIDFSENGQNIRYVWGGDRVIYDITGYGDWLFFTAFAGGFLASRDGGINWRRIYGSSLDSIQFNSGSAPSYRNRYFSCAADTSHGDSLVVWAGTAGGVLEYIFAPPREKPYSKMINRMAFCDGCTDSSYLFIAGNGGLTRGLVKGAPYISRFVEDGLPGSDISAVYDFRGRLFVGTIDPASQTPTGLAVSDDRGDSFTASGAFTADTISDFASIDERLYMAAGEQGLLVSPDTGFSWERILIDSTDPGGWEDNANSVYAVQERDGLLLVGTDTGLALLYLNQAGVIDSQQFHAFPEYDSTSVGDASSTRIIRAKTQPFYTYEPDTILDSLAIWTIHRPLSLEGRPIVGRHNIDSTRWLHLQVDIETNDVNFIGDTAYVVGSAGIRITTRGLNPGFMGDQEIIEVQQIVSGTVTDDLNDDLITVIKVKGDTLIFGTDNGFATSLGNDGGTGRNYRIVRVNNDSLAADAVVTHSPTSSGGGLVGSFIPALDVQYVDGEYARVWVSNRHREYGDTVAISVGRVVPVDENGIELPPELSDQAAGFVRKWQALYRDDYAWNFAFDGERAFAATNSGLIYNDDDTSTVWDTVALVDDNGTPLLGYNAAVYAVEVDPPYLWAGTDDRTVRFDLNSLADGEAFFVVDSTTPADEVYAFPVPFSHTRDPLVDFHFVVPTTTGVTLEIYDFAMNLVARVIDNETYPAGVYPGAGSYRATWDGYNGRGEQVAVGVYYFKVEFSGGETHWGKLAVMP